MPTKRKPKFSKGQVVVVRDTNDVGRVADIRPDGDSFEYDVVGLGAIEYHNEHSLRRLTKREAGR